MIYDPAALIGIFFSCYKSAIISLEREKELRKKEQGTYLEEELHPTVIDAGDPQSTDCSV